MSMKLFCGSSNRDLGERIARHLDMSLGEISLDRFADGEVNIFIGESVRNCECVIIQTTSQCGDKSVNDILMELQQMQQHAAMALQIQPPNQIVLKLEYDWV